VSENVPLIVENLLDS